MEPMIALPQMGTITFDVYTSGGRRDRSVKVVYINAGQRHWSWEIRDTHLRPVTDEQPAGVVVADSLVEAVQLIEIAVAAEYSQTRRGEKKEARDAQSA